MKNAESAQHKQLFTLRLAGLIALLALPQIGRAQYFELHTLAQFDGTNGSSPSALTLGNDGRFYGTTYVGGSGGSGVVFSVTTNGALAGIASFATNSGVNPHAALSLGPDGFFYGTTENGGGDNGGTVFKLSTNGALHTLASFDLVGLKYANGKNPQAALTLGTDGLFYGTTYNGGTNNYGAIFSVATNGALTGLVSLTNSFGSFPVAGLTVGSDGRFYGATSSGGPYNKGTIFSYSTNGTLTALTNFNGVNGATPNATLTLASDGMFYGTTAQGGAYSKGTVFSVTTNGLLTTLFSFNITNGALPGSALTLGQDGRLYGTTSQGGDTNFNLGQGLGTVFRISTNGTFARLIEFNGTNGAFPNAALIFGSDGKLYGTTTQGGAYDDGTVFQLAPLPPPPLDITLGSGATVVLSWTNPVYNLQSAPEVTGLYTNLPGALSPYTSSITGDRQFFRLMGN